ncbi:uncharacterized protein LOC141850456 [Brevipalpus obovatus]|uniref:uncharacterized protein LOC141850456 n=1 Tax=Brevipalpus obovatus TaxID=246614 RepID=UPI003D9E5416
MRRKFYPIDREHYNHLFPLKYSKMLLDNLFKNKNLIELRDVSFPSRRSIRVKFVYHSIDNREVLQTRFFKIDEKVPPNQIKKILLNGVSRDILIHLHANNVWTPDIPCIGLVNYDERHCWLLSCLQALMHIPDLVRLTEIASSQITWADWDRVIRTIGYSREQIWVLTKFREICQRIPKMYNHWEKGLKKLSIVARLRATTSRAIDPQDVKNSPGEFIGFLKAAANLNGLFISTPKKGYFQEVAMRFVLRMLMQELTALNFQDSFHHLFRTIITSKASCGCGFKSIFRNEFFYIQLWKASPSTSSLQEILDEYNFFNVDSCPDCEKKLIFEAATGYIPPYFIFSPPDCFPVRREGSNEKIIELPKSIILFNQKYEYNSIGCATYFTDHEMGHDFVFIRRGKKFVLCDDVNFPKISEDDALSLAEIRGRLYVLRKSID